MQTEFDLFWKTTIPYMPERLVGLVGKVNKRIWRGAQAGTLLIAKVTCQYQRPPIFTFIHRPKTWMRCGVMPYTQEIFQTVLHGLEEGHEVEDWLRSGQDCQAESVEKIHQNLGGRNNGPERSGIQNRAGESAVDGGSSERGIQTAGGEESISGKVAVKQYTCRKCGMKKTVVYENTMYTWLCTACGSIDKWRTR